MTGRIFATIALVSVMFTVNPAFALGEFNSEIEEACSGHAVQMLIDREILDDEKTIALHPDPQFGRRINFLSDNRWECKLHTGGLLGGSAKDGWAGDYRRTTESSGDAIWIILSPTTSPAPSY